MTILIKPKAVILHHSATSDGQTLSVSSIRKEHMSKGYDDIGYHFIIEQVNNYYEVICGRMTNIKGAHCRAFRMNHKALGVCFIGNFEITTMPDEQWQKGLLLVKTLIKQFDIKIENVKGHKEVKFSSTACPGKLFNLNRFREELVL